MPDPKQVEYITGEDGQPVGVVVPIDLWREIESERETAYLLRSDAMKQRLLDAKKREGGVTLEEVRAKLCI
jgi:PHD/YefM family antitoxin component YafN of YafNO toxin-antitoxin module